MTIKFFINQQNVWYFYQLLSHLKNHLVPSAVHQINKRYSIKLKPLNPKAIRSKSYSVPVSTSPAPVALPTLVNSNSQSSIDSVNQNWAVISNIISACNDYGTEEMIPIDKKIAYKVSIFNIYV